MRQLSLYQVAINNFGDELNEWIWNRLLPGIALTQSLESPPVSSHTLLSIGSYLAEPRTLRFAGNHDCIIAGTGCGYTLERCDFSAGFQFPYKSSKSIRVPVHLRCLAASPRTRVAWVRGPLTAQLIGVERARVIADGAYLLRVAGLAPAPKPRSGIALFPHVSTATLADLARPCEALGIRLIDPRSSRESILNEIASSELVLTEALHGAIVCDALRTPWTPVVCSDNTLRFKWLDYMASIVQPYDPVPIRVAWNAAALRRVQRSYPKKALFSLRTWLHHAVSRYGDTEGDLLEAIARPPILSSDALLSEFDDRLEEQIDMLRSEFAVSHGEVAGK